MAKPAKKPIKKAESLKSSQSDESSKPSKSTSTEKSSDESIEKPQRKRDQKAQSKGGDGFNPQHHKKHASNQDYFTCPKQNETLKQMRKEKYKSLSKMRKDLEQLNKDFGLPTNSSEGVGIVCNLKSQNAYLKCAFQHCKYEHWFAYDLEDQKLINIKYNRSINMNHCLSAHKSKVRREQPFL